MQSQSHSYIVKQPVHDKDSKLVAYELIYVESETSPDSPDRADMEAANAIETLLTESRDEQFLQGKTALVSVTPMLLIRDVPAIFDPSKFIIQIDEQVLLNPHAMKLVQKYKKQRYRIALKGFEYNARYLAALDHVDILKVNYADRSTDSEDITRIGKGLGKLILAYNVDTERSYERAKTMDVDYMQGTHIGSTLPEEIRKFNHLKTNFFELMSAVTKDDAEFDDIEAIISRDVTLTYRLMKLVNSAYFALRNKARSVHQALVILGLGQLRQWIYLLSFREDSAVPSEFIKTSFLRASFAQELLPLAVDVPISKGEAYLMGMFSTLGSLLDMPLEEALAVLDLSDEVKGALLNHDGRAGILYDLVLLYERGDWINMANMAEKLQIPVDLISIKYLECDAAVNDTWDRLMGEGR